MRAGPDLTVQCVREELTEVVGELSARAVDVDRAGTYPFESMHVLRDAGLLAAVWPTELGGRGWLVDDRYAEALAVHRLITAACSSTGQLYGVHAAAVTTIALLGTEEQKRYFSAPENVGGTFAYLGSEPGQRLTATGERIRYDSEARRVDGGWVVNARKAFATGSVGARWLMTFCMEEGAVDMTGLLIPVIPADAPGVTVKDSWDGMGQRSTASGLVEFTDVFVPDDHMIGEPGGLVRARVLGPMFQLGFAAMFTGMAQAAHEFAVDYVLHHAAAPLGLESLADDGHVQARVGDLKVGVEASWGLVRRAGELLSAACSDPELTVQARTAVYEAKVFASRASVAAGSDLFDITGGRSTSGRFDADRFWRNPRTLTLHDSLDKQRAMVGRQSLGFAAPAVSTR